MELKEIIKKEIKKKINEKYSILVSYTKCCNYFITNQDEPSIKKAISTYKIYGYNKNNFLMMTTKQLNRFKRKMNNLEKNFKNEHKDLRRETTNTRV